MTAHYDIVFEGRLLPDQELAAVKQRLVALFRSPEKIEALFAGERVLVKRAVNAQDAEQYRLAFAQAGAICELVPAGENRHGSGPSVPAPGMRTIPYSSPPQKSGHATMAYGSPVAGGDILAPTVPPEEATSPPPAPRVRPPSTAPIVPTPVPRIVPAPAVAIAPPRHVPLPPAPHASPPGGNERAIPDLAVEALPSPSPARPPGTAAGAAAAGAAAGAALVGNLGDLDVDEEAAPAAAAVDLLAPNSLDLDPAEDASQGVLEVAQEDVSSSTYDLSLPRLRRDDSGQIVAEAPLRPEPPGPSIPRKLVR